MRTRERLKPIRQQKGTARRTTATDAKSTNYGDLTFTCLMEPWQPQTLPSEVITDTIKGLAFD
jgi:hypothetical protein